MKIYFLSDARTELLEARNWYESKRLGLGSEFLAEVRRCVASVVQSPERFARVPKLAKVRNIRQATVGRFPFSIIYRLQAEQIAILAIAHQHRKPTYWHGRMKP